MDERHPRCALRLVPAAVALAALVALANLAGWVFDVRLLISVAPGLPAMVPVTALLSLLIAYGLWRAWRAPAGSPPVIAGAAIVVCVAIEACYLAGVAPAPFALAQSGLESAASLSSPTSTALLLALGCALLLSASAARAAAAQAITLAVLLFAVLNLGGHAFRDAFLLRVLPDRGMSIPTTAEVILLALGMLFLRPRDGLMAAVTGSLPGANISRRLLFSALFVPVMSAVLAVTGVRAGLYDARTVLPLFVWTVVVLFLVIIWRFAMQLSAIDVARADAQRGLQRALGKLRDEHDRKDFFMATLAHELRNPLAPISAAADLLRHGGGQDADERRRIGEIIAAQSANLVNLVNDLMDVERLSTGRITLDKHPLDIRLPVNSALEQTRPLMVRKRHDCHADLPLGLVCVCGDYTRLSQILANLLTNAAKYTAPGGRIRLRCAVSEQWVTIAVEDNGIGMAPALVERVFEPYVQAELTPDRTEGGLGLGLALVKRLTELHGGTVTAESDGTGKGSRFTVNLPLLKQETGAPPR